LEAIPHARMENLEQKLQEARPLHWFANLHKHKEPFKLEEFLEKYAYVVWQQAVLLETLHAAVALNKSPTGDAILLSRLIEKIRLIADSNITTKGKATNQLQLYLNAAQHAHADVTGINSFIARMRRGEPVAGALRTISVHQTVHELIQHTYVLVRTGEVFELAAAYLVSAIAADLPYQLLAFLNEPAQRKHLLLDKVQFYFAQYNNLLKELYLPSLRQLLTSMCADDEVKWQRAEDAALTVNRLLNNIALSLFR
jgi:hypothetical protein